MEDKVLDLLIEYYLNLNPVGEKEYWNEDVFEQKVYTAWGVMEIYNEIKNNPDTLPIEVVENFASKMNEYSCKDNKTSHIFSIAYDVSLDILDQLISMKEEENL